MKRRYSAKMRMKAATALARQAYKPLWPLLLYHPIAVTIRHVAAGSLAPGYTHIFWLLPGGLIWCSANALYLLVLVASALSIRRGNFPGLVSVFRETIRKLRYDRPLLLRAAGYVAILCALPELNALVVSADYPKAGIANSLPTPGIFWALFQTAGLLLCASMLVSYLFVWSVVHFSQLNNKTDTVELNARLSDGLGSHLQTTLLAHIFFLPFQAFPIAVSIFLRIMMVRATGPQVNPASYHWIATTHSMVEAVISSFIQLVIVFSAILVKDERDTPRAPENV